MPERDALLIACSSYDDAELQRLVAPAIDAERLAARLLDPAVGGFRSATVLRDPRAAELRHAMEEFFQGRRRDDLAVLYYSGHGYRNRRGAFFLTATDTRTDLLRSTAVEATHVRGVMDDSPSVRQVVILDCCFGAAVVGEGARGEGGVGAPVDVVGAFRSEGDGDGRYLITASSATEFAYEGTGRAEGEPASSRFTSFLLEGLETGAADTDGDGTITVDELYEYAVFRLAETADPRRPQTPQKQLYGQRAGELVLARSLAGPVARSKLTKAADLAVDGDADVRRVGIDLLAAVLTDAGDAAAQAQARLHLERLAASDDDPSVRAAAGRALAPTAPVAVAVASAPAAAAAGRRRLEVALQQLEGPAVVGAEVPLRLTVRNRGDVDLDGIEVRIDGRPLGEDLAIRAGHKRRRRVDRAWAAPGPQVVTAFVLCHDGGELVRDEATLTVDVQPAPAPARPRRAEPAAAPSTVAAPPEPAAPSRRTGSAIPGFMTAVDLGPAPFPGLVGRSPLAMLPAPEVSAVHTSVSNDLRWEPVDGATGYQVQRALTEAFDDPVTVGEGELRYCYDWFHDPGFPDGVDEVWYRVRATAELRVGAWSAPARLAAGPRTLRSAFLRAVTSLVAPSAPEPLPAPDVRGEYTSVSNDLRWEEVRGAAGYVVERALDAGFTEGRTTVYEGDAHYVFDFFSRESFPRTAPSLWYRVRATAPDRDGRWSGPVEIAGDFTAPTTLSSPGLSVRWTDTFATSPTFASGILGAVALPAPELTATRQFSPWRVELSWTRVTSAIWYVVERSGDLSFTDAVVVHAGPGTGAVDTDAGLLAWYRIRARNLSGEGPWSAPVSPDLGLGGGLHGVR